MIDCEKDLYILWEEFCRQGGRSSDNRLSGIDAGRPCRLTGPDYQGAEFELDGRIYRGDVEIHLKTSDWYAHQHHLDRHYEQVLLHLVWDHDTDIFIMNAQDQIIPTLSLRSFPRFQDTTQFPNECKWYGQKPENVSDALGELALQRLFSKHKFITRLSASMSLDQVLFVLLLRILGQPQNVNNFNQLGIRLPWEELMRIRDHQSLTIAHWQALLAIHSGMIDHVSSLRNLRQLQPQLEALYGRTSISQATMRWYFAGQRPQNNPVHHLKVLAAWLCYFPGRSLYHNLKKILTSRQPIRKVINALEDFFSPRQFCPLQNASFITRPWGKAKLTEIFGNVIIPFFHWESVSQASPGFKDYLESLYLSLPHTQDYARLNPFYRMAGLKSISRNRFFLNQGLLFLFDHFCRSGRCDECPFEIKHKDIDMNPENI